MVDQRMGWSLSLHHKRNLEQPLLLIMVWHCTHAPFIESSKSSSLDGVLPPIIHEVECACILASISTTRDYYWGVLRDHLSNFVCVFSSPVPAIEINSAEVLAIHWAIKLTLSCNWFNPSLVIVESDSSNAVRWCLDENGGPWNLNFILNAMKSEPNFLIQHKKLTQHSTKNHPSNFDCLITCH